MQGDSRFRSKRQHENACLMTNGQMCRRRLTLPEVEGLGGRQVGVEAVLASWREGGVHDGRYADQHHILHHGSIVSLIWHHLRSLPVLLLPHTSIAPQTPLPTWD